VATRRISCSDRHGGVEIVGSVVNGGVQRVVLLHDHHCRI
jgi:hypothetical protein